ARAVHTWVRPSQPRLRGSLPGQQKRKLVEEGRMQPLRGELAWVTGASRGIGRACALALARAGARVVLSARSVEDLQAAAEAIRAEGGEAYVFPLDLLDRAAIEACARRIEAEVGPVSIVVNNAGLALS